MLGDAVYRQIAKIIFKYLDPKKNKVMIFGSRALQKNRPYSDVDICLKASKPVPFSVLSQLSEELEDSDIPYRVDLVDFHSMSFQFKQVAMKKIINLNQLYG
jgi:predicted nucleotidyltransferase